MSTDQIDNPVCMTCGGPLVSLGADIWSTLVGYGNGECGNEHDDNCTSRSAWCQAGHRTTLSIRRSCTGCDWRGQRELFLSPGKEGRPVAGASNRTDDAV